MNNLEIYVNYVQPVVKAVNEHHNDHYRLEYFSISAEDLFAEDGLIEFMTQDKHLPEHFRGTMPMVYAQWGEETGASLVLEIAPENRKLLSPEVVEVIVAEHNFGEARAWEWEKTADQTLFLHMDHEYYQTCAGFATSNEFEDSVSVGPALDFLSRRLGLTYLTIDTGVTDLEYRLWGY